MEEEKKTGLFSGRIKLKLATANQHALTYARAPISIKIIEDDSEDNESPDEIHPALRVVRSFPTMTRRSRKRRRAIIIRKPPPI